MPITLINNTGTTSIIGKIVAIDTRNPDSFVYVGSNATKAIGVVTEAVAYRKPCKIAIQGETTRVLIQGNVNKNDVLRTAKSTDRTSLGVGVIAKTGDAPYMKIGDTLQGGNKLISCVLDFMYMSGASTGDHVADGVYTVGLGTITDGIIEVKNGVIVSITEAT